MKKKKFFFDGTNIKIGEIEITKKKEMFSINNTEKRADDLVFYKQRLQSILDITQKNLDHNGWRKNNSKDDYEFSPIEPNSFDTADQFKTASLFLSQIGPPAKTIFRDRCSYGLKHDAERWGSKVGLHHYVSNGIMIAAMIDGEFTTKNLRRTSDLSICGKISGKRWTQIRKFIDQT